MSKQTNDKSTARPWRHNFGTLFISGAIKGGEASIVEAKRKYVSNGEAAANASLIVKAVNEYAALIEIAELAAMKEVPIFRMEQALANLAALRGESEGGK